MKDCLFQQLAASLKEGGAILRGKKKPTRTFIFPALQKHSYPVIGVSKGCQIAMLSVFMNTGVFGQACTIPPDIRTWDEVVAEFVTIETKSYFHGDDGLRLKELDPKKALVFLLPYVGKQHPRWLRLKAVGSLGACAYVEAIPALSAIAKDTKEDEELRALSLNPGLRYMNSSKAVETAESVIDDNSRFVRTSACWVLSQHGSDRAVDALEKRIKTKGLSDFELQNLVCALYYTKSERAGKIISSNCDFTTLPKDENLISAYAMVMDKFRIPDAKPTMLQIARVPGGQLSREYAFRYFSSFPSEDVVPALVEFITARGLAANLNLYDTVTAFVKSDAISEASKKTLNGFIESGKVKKSDGY